MSSSAPERSLRVCLDARIADGIAGGIQQTILGLATGLAALDDSEDEYLFLVADGAHAWLDPYLRGRCRAVAVPHAPGGSQAWRARVRRALGPKLERALVSGPLGPFIPVGVPRSDGTIERAGVEVMHFTTQSGFSTSVPTVFVPHDLQHLHHPEFFLPFERRTRAAVYPTLARQACAVIALSQDGKRDLVERLGLVAEKVHVIGWAPVLEAYATPTVSDLAAVRRRHELPAEFVLFPAQTFPHKNHLTLLDALARLRDARGLVVPLVCPGRRSAHFSVVARRVDALGLAAQVRFLDYVPSADLAGLYRLARAVVFPSLFEGYGLPIVEAFHAHVPVACSAVTSLPELAGDAALLFDPRNPEELASALERLWTDAALRAELVARGRRRVAGLTWREVARRYRALYRHVAGRTLSGEDAALLASAR